MKFSSEQQEFIDALINKRVAQVRTKAEAAVTPEAVTDIKRLLSEAHDKLRIAELKAAAASHGAINPSQVAALLDSNVKVDTIGNLYVVDGAGVRQFTKDGAALSINEAMETFLTANPNHVKASVTTGAGSAGNRLFGGITRVIKRWQYDKLSPTERMERILDGATVVD